MVLQLPDCAPEPGWETGADKGRQGKNDVALIIAMLLGISIASGLVIQYLLG